MHFPIVSGAYAGLFGMLFTALSVHVVILRGRTGIVHGDGGNDILNRTIRAHANFSEYVPLLLLMTALLEGGGAPRWMIHLLLGPLLAARLVHPAGMRQPVGSVRQYALRATSTTITWLVLISASVLLLLRAM